MAAARRRYRDFDAARAERKAKLAPPCIRVLGEDVELPAGIPAWLGLELGLLCDQHGAGWQPSAEVVHPWLARIVGDERSARWLAELDIDEYLDLFVEVFACMSGDDDDEDPDADGEGDAAGEGSRPPSS